MISLVVIKDTQLREVFKIKYIALLRGVNVGGKNKVPMSELKACFENAGFLNTMTYINSGNVIFESEEQRITKLSKRCEEIIENTFGFPIRVALIDVNTLTEAAGIGIILI